MNAQPFEPELRAALAAVRDAAALCQAVQAELGREALQKKDRSPVTVADFGSQALVARALAQSFPADPLVAEEDSDALRAAENSLLRAQVVNFVSRFVPDSNEDSVLRSIDHGRLASPGGVGRFWTLDPIDGTKGFLRNEQYAIALALIIHGNVTVAAVACPSLSLRTGDSSTLGAIFTAVSGQGAWVHPLVDSHATEPIRLSVSDRTDPTLTTICESVESGHSAHGASADVASLLHITAPPVRLDSQAKYAVVARGEADIYLRLPTRADYSEKIWDHAAGSLLVTESGGRVTDISGKSLDFTLGSELSSNRGVIVTNGWWHERVLEALRERGVV
jgi:HAL2 family 3'(2'),5'-bisphosphate nucleotidase